jgi:hypothetical protein
MPMNSFRKLAVLDAMIVVAATAPALAVMRRQCPLGWDQRSMAQRTRLDRPHGPYLWCFPGRHDFIRRVFICHRKMKRLAYRRKLTRGRA